MNIGYRISLLDHHYWAEDYTYASLPKTADPKNLNHRDRKSLRYSL
jgi:hypothetical protein